MKPFVFEQWHAWESNGKIMLSDESTKTLRTFSTTDDVINWLFLVDQKTAARALNNHAGKWNHGK